MQDLPIWQSAIQQVRQPALQEECRAAPTMPARFQFLLVPRLAKCHKWRMSKQLFIGKLPGPTGADCVTRRHFLRTSAIAIGTLQILPSRVLGAAARPGPNQRLTIAHIGNAIVFVEEKAEELIELYFEQANISLLSNTGSWSLK